MNIVINSDKKSAIDGPQTTVSHFYQHVLACLDYPPEQPPVADLLAQSHGLSGEWLIASPIHWIATHNDGMIDGSRNTLQLTEGESRAWFDAFSEFVRHDAIKMVFHDAYTWLIQSPFPPIQAKPVSLIYHQSLMPELKSIDATYTWQKFLTEAQMFLSAHRLNQTRTDCPINGIWVWGRGSFKQDSRLIICDESLQDFAAQLSSQVMLYKRNKALPNHALLLFNTMTKDRLNDLERQSQTHVTRWYWNNMTYERPSISWLKRLWSNIHAD